MFTFYTRHEAQVFESKKQALDFYERGAFETEGAESARYSDYANAIRMSGSAECAKFMFARKAKITFKYDPKKDRLVKIA